MAVTRRQLVGAMAAAAVGVVLAGCGRQSAGATGPLPAGPATPSAGLAVRAQQEPETLTYAAVETTDVVGIRWDASAGLGIIIRTPVAAPHLATATPVTAPAGSAGPWVLRDRRQSQVVGTLTATPDHTSATLARAGHGTETLTLVDEGKYEELLALHARS